jgi:hypothetical protein
MIDPLRSQARVDKTTRVLQSIGYYPLGDLDTNIEIIPVTPEILEAIKKPALEHRIGVDGKITSLDVPPPPPPPIVYQDEEVVKAQTTTTDAVAKEIVRFTLTLQTGYSFDGTIIGADRGNGAMRKIVASVLAKRLNGGAILVGPPIVVLTHPDAATTGWQTNASVSGNDLSITVQGAAGRTVDWMLRSKLIRFGPGGLT